MALQYLWQQQRQQRQDELVTRQQSVRIMLTRSQKERQAAAARLRDDLSQFRASLVQADQIRLVAAQELQVDRQFDRRQRLDEVQAFLADTSEQRQVKAQQVAQELTQFVQSLQHSTADFLALTGAERDLMAHQLARDLRAFRKALSHKVETLRQTLQTDIKTLQTETQLSLYQHQQERLRQQIQLSQELAIFVDSLRIDVQNHLTELAATRQDRATNVQNYLAELAANRQDQAMAIAAMLEQSRRERLAEVETLLARCAVFRTHLQTYHASLGTLVWGKVDSARPTTTPTAPVVPKSAQAVKAAPAPLPQKASPPTIPPPTAVVKATAPAAKVGFGKVKATASPTASDPTPAKAAIAPPSAPSPLNLDELSQVIGAFSDEGLLKSPVASVAPQTSEADQILQYLSAVEGARLTELESALGLSRFKAVDTLRALIRAGSITQRDRQYVLQT